MFRSHSIKISSACPANDDINVCGRSMTWIRQTATIQ